MAKTKHASPPPFRGRPPIYPWDKWLRAGRKARLVKGEHFHCETRSFELSCRKQLSRRGMKGTIRIHDLTVIVEVH